MRKLEQASGHLTEYQAWREDIGWQNRSASLIDLDEMIGGIVEGISKLGILNNTVRSTCVPVPLQRHSRL